MTEVENLWPKNIGQHNQTVPREILDRQALYLAEMTSNLLIGEVNTTQGNIDNKNPILVHEFKIKSPSLGGYQFTLARVAHGFTIYPVTIYFVLTEEKFEANDENDFKGVLAHIFGSEMTLNAISSIIGASTATKRF